MAEAQEDPIIVYECTRCYVIIPYLSCYHNCPAVEVDQEEEGFQEDLVGWYVEIKKRQKEDPRSVRIVEAPEPQNLVEVLPNQPFQQYHEDIRGPGLEGSYHISRQWEEVPDGIQPIRMFEIGPGQYRLEEEVLAEEEKLAEEFRQQQQQEEQREEYRLFEEIFQEFREPYP